ncbi:MAG: ketoacyl-ACP synthase III [Syntrophales bacterium]|nr:ketoacyl-ACP synthase III [Syntrophales bacterium]
MLYLHGIGHFYPENVITNQFLEDLDIGTDEDWILERVGVRTRRTVLPLDYIKTTKNLNLKAAFEAALYNNVQTGAAAARMALERAGLKPEDIGMVISGSCAPDNLTPAESATIAAELGIDVTCFDINSACSSFGMQINVLAGMRSEALPPFVLVVNPENLTRSVNYSDRGSAVLFGDGSSAAVVSAIVPSRASFVSCYSDSKPSAWEKVSIPRMDYFQQDGNAVQRFAIHKTTESLRMLKELYPVNGDRFKFIGHQANLSMLNTVCERTGIAVKDHWYNVTDYGNTGCSGAPAVLSQHWDDLKPGHHVAISLVGAGLTWTHTLLKVEGE